MKKYPKDYLGLANELPPEDKRLPNYDNQLVKRGWDDTELWSLDTTFLKFIISRLTVFIDANKGWPSDLSKDRWNIILQQMLDDFTYLRDHQYDAIHNSSGYEKSFNRAFDNFKKYFHHLWI